MSRLPPLERGQLSPEAQDLWAAIAGPSGRLTGPFYSLIRKPELARAVWGVGEQVRFTAGFSEARRELAILATAGACGEERQFANHEPKALRLGIPRETIEAARSGAGTASLDPAERVMIEFPRTLVKEQRVDDELFARAVAILGEESLIELVGLVGFYTVIAMVVGTFGHVQAPAAQR